MKKKALLLASMGVLACTVGVTALAVNGINRLDAFPVKADPKEYCVTFDASDTANTTVVTVGEHYAICTTTENGNKVGVAGFHYHGHDRFSFRGNNFYELQLFDFEGTLASASAYEFHTITGFAISFSGGSDIMSMEFAHDEGYIHKIVSGKEYKGLSIPSGDDPRFMTERSEEAIVAVTSLTIWYSC